MTKTQFLLTSLVGALPCGAMFGLLIWMWLNMATFGDMPGIFHVFAGVTAVCCAVGAFIIPIGILLQKTPEFVPAPAGAAPAGDDEDEDEFDGEDDAGDDFDDDDDEDDGFDDFDDDDDDFDDFDDDEF